MVENSVKISLTVSFLVCVAGACFAGGTISGTVEDSNETAISGVQVDVYDDSWLGRVQFDEVGTDETDANGGYSITGLDAGTYTVVFAREGYAPHLEHTKTVTDGNTTDVDASLVTGGSVSGNVQVNDTDAENVNICANKNGWFYGVAVTDANGDYSIAKIEAGTYTLVMTYIEPNTGARVYDIVRSVGVTNGQDTGNKDFSVCADDAIPADPGPPCRGRLYVTAKDDRDDAAENVFCVLVGPDGHATMRPDYVSSAKESEEGPILENVISVFHSVPSGPGFQIKVLRSSLGTGSKTNVTLTNSGNEEIVTVE